MSRSLPTDQVIGIYRKNVGAIKVAIIHDGMLSTSFNNIVGADPKVCEAMHRAAFRQLPPELSCNTFVVETAQQLALIDCGCGSTTPGAGKQLEGLAALGIAPSDVDAVFMTHLHRDHAAGLIDQDSKAVFPNATLVVLDAELAFWRDETSIDRLRDSQKRDFFIAKSALAAYAERMRPISSGETIGSMSAVASPGHTPGHTAWLLHSESEQLMIWGDVVHLPAIQFSHPEVSIVYDVDSTAAATARRRVLDQVATDRVPVAGVHLDFPCVGHVERMSDNRFTYTPEIWTSTM